MPPRTLFCSQSNPMTASGPAILKYAEDREALEHAQETAADFDKEVHGRR